MKTKTRKLITAGKMLMLFMFVGGVLASCSKDKNEDAGVSRADFERNYFGVEGGDFQGRPLPGSNSSSLEILNISGNPTVLAGGSNPINVVANDNAREVIVGVEDRDGYFTIPLVQGREGESRGGMSDSMIANLQLMIGLEASDSFIIAFAAGDGQGNFSEYQYLPVNIMDSGIGLLKVTLTWDQENDVDLHLIEPNGEEIYYGNSTSLNGGNLDIDSNAACGIDNINNENIFYEDDENVTIEYGEYEVLVDLWSNCDVSANTGYTVRVYYGDEEITPTQGVNPHVGVLTPEDESHNSSPISVMKFTIDGPPSNRGVGNRTFESIPKVFKFNHDKNNKVFQEFSQVKE